MKFSVSRIILFVKNFDTMTDFYGNIFELPLLNADSEGGTSDFLAGDFILSLHRSAKPNGRTKLNLYSENVHEQRDIFLGKGVEMGEVYERKKFLFCEGKDPDGNSFLLTNRK